MNDFYLFAVSMALKTAVTAFWLSTINTDGEQVFVHRESSFSDCPATSPKIIAPPGSSRSSYRSGSFSASSGTILSVGLSSETTHAMHACQCYEKTSPTRVLRRTNTLLRSNTDCHSPILMALRGGTYAYSSSTATISSGSLHSAQLTVPSNSLGDTPPSSSLGNTPPGLAKITPFMLACESDVCNDAPEMSEADDHEIFCLEDV